MAGGRAHGRSRPEPVGALIDSVMGRLGYRKRAPALFAMAVWDQAVGGTVARHAVPERVDRDVLHVVVDGAAWADELRWMESALVAQLNAACGRTAVSRLRFRIGTLPRRPPAETERVQLPDAVGESAVTADLRRQAARIARHVTDRELQRTFARLVTQALRRTGNVAGQEEEGRA
jgi:hypothetical protein